MGQSKFRRRYCECHAEMVKFSLAPTVTPPRDPRGFTYIEVLLTLAILAILFVPTMQLFSHAMEATRTSRDLMTAVSLARWEMERVKNVGVSTQRLKETGNITWPPETEAPVQLNGRAWRIYRVLKEGTEPLEVAVEVRAEKESKAMVRLVTLITDMSWGQQAAQ